MSVRTKMLGFVDVILRVPPIFIIDEILKISMGLPFNTQTNDPTLDTNHMSIMDGAITSAATTTTTTTSAASDADNNILVNGSSSISSNLSNSFSAAAAINSTLEQIFNETTNSMFGGGEAASAAAAGTAEAFVDDTEFYKLLSLTTLKFFSCLLGKANFMFSAFSSLLLFFVLKILHLADANVSLSGVSSCMCECYYRSIVKQCV